MASKSKIKGNTYERELVNLLKEYNLSAERARGSDGRSLGLTEDIDLVYHLPLCRGGMTVMKKIKVQAKRRKKIPNWLKLGNADMVMVREDNGHNQVIVDLDFLLTILNQKKK